MKPLTLRNIAHNVRMHESNVSRATAGKYLATPSSIFLFRYFFDSPFHSILGGNAHSAKAVRYRIKCLIEQELLDTVISDNRIAPTLRYEGVDIARRTIAKYREAMRIPSSIRRRRLKKINYECLTCLNRYRQLCWQLILWQLVSRPLLSVRLQRGVAWYRNKCPVYSWSAIWISLSHKKICTGGTLH